MYGEVTPEYLIYYPLPGETYFIHFGLLSNVVFFVYALYCVNDKFNLFDHHTRPYKNSVE